MKLAGEKPSPRPAVRDGMKQELYESRFVKPRIKESGVGRDFWPHGTMFESFRKRQPCFRNDDESSSSQARPSLALRGIAHEVLVFEKLRG